MYRAIDGSHIQIVEWATDLAKGLGAYVGVDLRGLAGAMPKQGLNVAQVRAFLRKVGCEALPTGTPCLCVAY